MDAEYDLAEGIDDAGEPESVDPQQWIDQLAADLHRIEGQYGEDHRDALKARIDLATAYRQIGEPGLAVPLAIRNTAHAEQLFPHLAPSLRSFQDEVCAVAGYTVSDVKLLGGMEAEEPQAEAAAEDDTDPADENTEILAGEEEPVAVLVEEHPAILASAAAVTDLSYEVLKLRFELDEAHRTIGRLRRRNAKLLEALADDND